MARDNGATSRLGLFMTARAVHYNTTPPVSLQEQVKQGIKNKTGYLNVFQCEAPPIPVSPPLPPPPLHDENAMRTSTYSPDPHAGNLGDPHIAGQGRPLNMQTSSTPQHDLVRAHDSLPNVSAVNATAHCPAQRPGATSVFPSGYAAASLSACLPTPHVVGDTTTTPFAFQPDPQSKLPNVAPFNITPLPVPVVPSPQIPAVPPPSSPLRSTSAVKQELILRGRKAGHPYHRALAHERANASMSAAHLPEERMRQASGNAQRVSWKGIAVEMHHRSQKPPGVMVDHAHRNRIRTAGTPGRLPACTGSSARPAASGTSTRPVVVQADRIAPAVPPFLLTNTQRMEEKVGSERFAGPHVSDPVQLCYPNPTSSPGRPHTSSASAVHPASHSDMGTPQRTPSVPYRGSVSSGQQSKEVAYGRRLAEELTSPQGSPWLIQTTGLSGTDYQHLVNGSIRPLNEHIIVAWFSASSRMKDSPGAAHSPPRTLCICIQSARVYRVSDAMYSISTVL